MKCLSKTKGRKSGAVGVGLCGSPEARGARNRGRHIGLPRHFMRCERGTQLVELAIVLPILLTLFAVTAEMGRLYFSYTTLAKGTRVAVRYLTTVPLNTTANRDLYFANARNLVVYGKTAPQQSDSPIISGLTTNNVVISTAGGTSIIPQTVTVQITGINFVPLINLGQVTHSQSLSLNVPLTPSTTMRYMINQPIN